MAAEIIDPADYRRCVMGRDISSDWHGPPSFSLLAAHPSRLRIDSATTPRSQAPAVHLDPISKSPSLREDAVVIPLGHDRFCVGKRSIPYDSAVGQGK